MAVPAGGGEDGGPGRRFGGPGSDRGRTGVCPVARSSSDGGTGIGPDTARGSAEEGGDEDGSCGGGARRETLRTDYRHLREDAPARSRRGQDPRSRRVAQAWRRRLRGPRRRQDARERALS